ncbi:hypothetical protein RM572_18390 [Streptomyces sp. DSM 42041]|uniref:Uncharacterized protein n=1 Tax=Streptomyces hazeniae TaxID=3075538 RepID=A0ABU2NVH0_9ACTN|nr:hypothetical protein [Streptomyces sp. DSM 42041]MDT0380725.1 hypothetical protein [Streptomyces sp. DSM 42041]
MRGHSSGQAVLGCLGTLAGTAAGAAAWQLSDAARRYCGSYPEHGWWGLHPGGPALPASLVAGALVAAAAQVLVLLALRGRDVGARRAVTVTALAVTVALALLTWAHFAWWGTVPFPGAPSNSGRCGPDNVPDWWPAWLPA